MATMSSLEKIPELLNSTPHLAQPCEVETVRDLKSTNRVRLIKTIILLMAMIFLGFTCALAGTSFVDMEAYLGCDTRTLSMALSLQSVGIIIGSLLSVFQLNRLSEDVTIGLFFSLTSIAIMSATAIKSIYWYFLTMTSFCCFFAIAICEFQPYLMKIWENHRLKEPIVHSVHALWSLGVAIGPIIITPFLVKSTNIDSFSKSDDASLSHRNSTSEFIYLNNDTILTDQNRNYNTTEDNKREYTGLVLYAYIVVGFPLLVPSVIFLIYSILTGASLLRKHQRVKPDIKENNENKLNQLTKIQRYIFLIGLFLYSYAYAIVEMVPTAFLTLFTTSFLGWKSPERTLINTAFFGCLCVGRVVGIFVSALIKQRNILAINNCTAILACILFLFSTYHHIIVWFAAALFGFGLSTMWAALVLWSSLNVEMTQRIMALMIVVSSLGGFSGPALVGQLVTRFNPMCMIYILLISVIAEFFIFLFMAYIEKKGKRRLKRVSEPAPILHKNLPNPEGDKLLTLTSSSDDKTDYKL